MFVFDVEDSSKLYFSADSHFDHFNICRYCNRPFQSRSEMNNALIDNWNSVVPEDGVVVHCGDFTLSRGRLSDYEKIWSKLNFSTMILCRGNHDIIDSGGYSYGSKKVIVVDMAIICVDDINIYAQHYPCLTFNGDYQVFGHIHTLSDGLCHGADSFVNDKLGKNQYDVGVDQNKYFPVSYEDLMKIFKER